MDIDEHFKSLKAIYPFNFDLKDEQKRVIQAVMDKKDASVLLPTGYGKSMCYVVPPLLFDQRDPSIQHTAMVVSPLVSLMQDQQQHLSNIGISSTILSPSDVGAMLDVEKKPVSIVFCTPEALQTSAVRKLLMSKTFNKRLSLLACDEAHCISEWGESFRPEYRQIAIVRSLVDAPLLALTATATEQVQKDICQYLMIDDTAICVAKLPDRPNIFLAIQTSSTPDCELELKWLKEAAVSRESMKKVIVFCR
ncbi:uncharacterized protein LOC132737858 [Ruditapes philippinarum]|uniref:uncharacterized protein LOC132737858 n=1 Tax=Ruditapes philippinarum TaxID=129788 RepID=UPI00295C01A3|nr:uncharacterized protein LOC132737858 [Ruditapes philippinarum]